MSNNIPPPKKVQRQIPNHRSRKLREHSTGELHQNPYLNILYSKCRKANKKKKILKRARGVGVGETLYL
jgi:hypothetical protein